MDGLTFFLVGIFAVILDPITLVGVVVAGLVARKALIALAGGFLWGIAMIVLAKSLAASTGLDNIGPNSSFAAETLIARLLAPALAAWAVYGIKLLIRRHKQPNP